MFPPLIVGSLSLEHGALALFGAGEHQHRRLLPSIRLLRNDLNELIVTTHRVGGPAITASPLPQALLRGLPLGANGAASRSTEATNARLARKATAADAVGVVVRRRGEAHVSLTDRSSAAAAAAANTATLNAGANKVAHGRTALTSSEVLATLVLGSRGGLKLLKRWGSARLTRGVLASTSLTGTESAGHRRLREADGTNKSRLGAFASRLKVVESQGRNVLLVATTESVRRWRRQWGDVNRRGLRLLRGGRAARAARVALERVGPLVRRRLTESGRAGLGRRVGETRSRRRRRVGKLRLLRVLIHDILVLAGHRVVDNVKSGMGVLRLLELLAVETRLWRHRSHRVLLLAHVASVDVHASKLLSGEAEQLLLKLLLALLKVELSSHELGSEVGIEVCRVIVVELDGRRSQHLLGKRVDLATSRDTVLVLEAHGETRANGSLGAAVARASVETGLLGVTHAAELVLVERRGLGHGTRSLGRSAQASKEVRAAGPGGGLVVNGVLANGTDLWRCGSAETLQVVALAARREAGRRNAETSVGGEVVVGHLSKTASVHAHYDERSKRSDWGFVR